MMDHVPSLGNGIYLHEKRNKILKKTYEKMCSLAREDDLFILTLANGKDNSFTVPFIKDLFKALDEVEGIVRKERLESAALVTVVSPTAKIYSNGLDLSMFAKPPSEFEEYLKYTPVSRLNKQFLLDPC
jgi:enoyl-CoA hydratase/carnithine racemase